MCRDVQWRVLKFEKKIQWLVSALNRKKATSISSINNNNNLYCSGDRYDQKGVINFSDVCAFGLYSAIKYIQTLFSVLSALVIFIWIYPDPVLKHEQIQTIVIPLASVVICTVVHNLTLSHDLVPTLPETISMFCRHWSLLSDVHFFDIEIHTHIGVFFAGLL